MNIVEKSKSIMLSMGAAPIMFLMIGLSVLSVAVILERAWFFRSIGDDLESLARELAAKLRGKDLEGARRRMEASRSAEAAIVVAGLHEASRGAEAAEEAMAGATALQRMRLERRLVYLGTLGNNAPFIGLFGTVVGIVEAFDKLGKMGAGTAQTGVMGSIAEALVATAIGLAVAIPAVAAFNWFQRRIKSTLGNAEALSRVLLAHLKGTDPERTAAEPGEESHDRPTPTLRSLQLVPPPSHPAPISSSRAARIDRLGNPARSQV